MHLVLTLFIAIGVECSTGVLGVVLLAVFLFLYKKIRFIFRPFFAIILMLLFGAFFYCMRRSWLYLRFSI